MAFNIAPFGKILKNLMYSDSCTISRVVSKKDEYGATLPSSREDIYKDIPCKFSFNQKDDPKDTNEVYMPVLKQVTLFAELSYNIVAGDYITGKRTDPASGISQDIKGICGEPNRFNTHQEIPIQIEEEN